MLSVTPDCSVLYKIRLKSSIEHVFLEGIYLNGNKNRIPKIK